jgi:hypothetical protein
MEIVATRDSDGKQFTTNMSNDEGIYEMHFCTSYTQVMIQEIGDDGKLKNKEIICPPHGTEPNPIDLIATQNDETGILSARTGKA